MFATLKRRQLKARHALECLDRVLAHSAECWAQRTQRVVRQPQLDAATTRQRFNGSVLVVDDNQVNQKVAQRFLERLGCSVTIAADGAEGVRAYEQGNCDVILMDLQMPIMDGYAATRRIRELERGLPKHTPIIALTADAMAGQLEKCQAAGMDDYLPKPINADQLRDLLRQHLCRADGAAAAARS